MGHYQRCIKSTLHLWIVQKASATRLTQTNIGTHEETWPGGPSDGFRCWTSNANGEMATLHTLLQNTILSHFRPYNYTVPYHTIPRCSLWWWMLIVRWPDAPPAPGPNQVITQWPGLITMRLITPHTIITDHLAISYNITACWCTLFLTKPA